RGGAHGSRSRPEKREFRFTMTQERWLRTNLILAALFGASMAMALSLGTNPVHFFKALFFNANYPTDVLILWQIRLPRCLMAALAGASLSITGALFQA